MHVAYPQQLPAECLQRLAKTVFGGTLGDDLPTVAADLWNVAGFGLNSTLGPGKDHVDGPIFVGRSAKIASAMPDEDAIREAIKACEQIEAEGCPEVSEGVKANAVKACAAAGMPELSESEAASIVAGAPAWLVFLAPLAKLALQKLLEQLLKPKPTHPSA
jgi:hypothetical protein